MQKLRITSVLITLIMIFCGVFTSCGGKNTVFSTGPLAEKTKADNVFFKDSESYETVAKNSFIELCADKKNHSIIVKDLTTGYKWSALKKSFTDGSYAFALTLYTDNGIYEFNTQADSVAMSSSVSSIENGILSVTYTISNNKETAKKAQEEMTAEDIFAIFTVTYELKNQSVVMTIDTADLVCTKGAFVKDISIMPCFASDETDSNDDWFLIPDNSGALMNLSRKDDSTNSININVYGNDPYNHSETESASATLPVFGAKRGNSAFIAVITDGDALASIKANRSAEGKLSAIYPVFTITQVKHIDETSVYKGVSYNGKISVSYKFLSGSNATYSAMASAAREEFILSSRLSSEKSTEVDNLPFNLTVVGAEKSEILTTTNQTTDILGILKGKGISNIVLSYNGIYKGGTANSNIYTSAINNKNGGKNGLESLYDYTQKQGCTLLLGANIFSSGRNYSIGKNSFEISGKTAEFMMQNDLGYNSNASSSFLSRIGKEASDLGTEKANPAIYSEDTFFEMNLMNLSAFSTSFTKYLDSDITSYADGISVTDAGQILYSDGNNTRQDAMNEISSMLRAVSNYGVLSVSGGNLYSLYNASYITNMQFDTFYPESEAYEAVPFAQAVLHGNVLYSGLPIDAGNPLYRYNMLRFIEYGAVPAYEWIYEDANIYCYSGYLLSERLSEIVDFYNDASEMFSDLTDETITDHRKITNDSDGNDVTGVYCTTYSDGTEIYVNYTGSIVTTDGNIAIGPYDYVKVKR